MFGKKIKIALLISGMLLFVWSCSTQKDRFLNRAFHRTTANYNAYFNANETFKGVVSALAEGHKDDYKEILSVDRFGTEDEARAYHGQLDEVIEKCTKVIKRHSMNIKGKEKNARIDDNYMLIALAQFYKQEFIAASATFNYIARQYDDGDFKNQALIWEAYAQMKLRNYQTASVNFNNLEENEKLNKSEQSRLYAIKAQYSIDQEKYEDAILYLRKAIEAGVSRDEKIRYTFITAQLFHKIGDEKKSIDYYERVVKANPPYDIKFNALMNEANVFDTDEQNPKELSSRLLEMTEDSKNKEYLDQIYYALADLSRKQGDEEEAMEYLMLSAQYSLSNNEQKALTHLRIADIYFDKKDYLVAQAHYDTVISVIDANYPSYKKISTKRNSLTDLVGLYNTIELQDSLIRIASMSEAERNAFIDDYISDLKAKIEEEKRLQAQAAADKAAFVPGSNKQNPFAISGGGWYFYNPSAVSFGYSEFVSKWGDRKLEDNWRRQNKNKAFGSGDEEEEEDILDGERFSRDFYIDQLPLTAEAMAESYDLIADAYYQLGLLYKEDLQDYPASVEEFTALNNRFSDTKYGVIAHYQLFRLYLLMEDASNAAKHKNIVLNQYPDSHFAKSIQGVSLENLGAQEEDEMETRYKQAYNAFEAQNYALALQMTSETIKNFPTDESIPKFALLGAMATGGAKGKGPYIAELEKIVAEYDKHPVAAEATYILNALQGDTETFDLNKYSKVKKTDHFYVLFAKIGQVDINELYTEMTNYTGRAFPEGNLRLKKIVLNDEYEVITVKLFQNATDAMNFYRSIQKDYKIKPFFDTGNLLHVLMSSKNFSTFYKGDKNIVEYMYFFNEVYLKQNG